MAKRAYNIILVTPENLHQLDEKEKKVREICPVLILDTDSREYFRTWMKLQYCLDFLNSIL